MIFKKFVLKSYPSDHFPEDLSCFEFIDNAKIDESMIPEGSAFIKVYWISLDPLLRTWISGAKSYLDPVKPGSGVPGFGVAKVVKINYKKGKKTTIEPGDWVIGMLEWS
jgi:NADPH-dependent curcumin reductase CurA